MSKLYTIAAFCFLVGYVAAGRARAVEKEFNVVECIDQLEGEFKKFKIPSGVRTMIDQIRKKFPGKSLLKVDEIELIEGNFAWPDECNSYPERVAAVARRVSCYKPDDDDPILQEKEIALDEVASTRRLLDDVIGAAGICGLLGDRSFNYDSDSDSDYED